MAQKNGQKGTLTVQLTDVLEELVFSAIWIDHKG